MNKNTGVVMQFAGAKYDMAKLMGLLGTCPKVKINELQFNGPAKDDKEAADPRFQELRKDQIVTYHGEPAEYPQCVIVVKQHGKYTFLYGEGVRDAFAEAYLVTSHTLKKVRYEQSQPATAERVMASAASGPMANKMQEAFRGNREPANVKVHNHSSFGSHAPSNFRGDDRNSTNQRGTFKSPQYHSGARTRREG